MNTGTLVTLGGWILLALGFGAAAWGLFRDRARGRWRCSRCWYSMDGAPRTERGFVCPECGRAHADEKRMLRTRRRWKWVLAGVALLAASWVTRHWVAISSGAWPTAIPNQVLLWIAPARHAPAGINTNGQSPLIVPTPTSLLGLTFFERLTQETWERLADGRLSGSGSAHFVNRVMSNSPYYTPIRWVWMPRRWFIGHPIPISFEPSTAAINVNLSQICPQGQEPQKLGFAARQEPYRWTIDPSSITNSAVTLELDLILNDRVLLTKPQRVRAPQLVELEQLLPPWDGDASNLPAALDPRLVLGQNGPELRIADRANTPAWDSLDCIVAFTFEILLDDRVLATGSCGSQIGRAVMKNWREPRLHWADHGPADAQAAPDRLELHIRGDRAAAAAELLADPLSTDDPRVWLGSVRVPLPFRAD